MQPVLVHVGIGTAIEVGCLVLGIRGLTSEILIGSNIGAPRRDNGYLNNNVVRKPHIAIKSNKSVCFHYVNTPFLGIRKPPPLVSQRLTSANSPNGLSGMDRGSRKLFI